jgi:hypothetical protein
LAHSGPARKPEIWVRGAADTALELVTRDHAELAAAVVLPPKPAASERAPGVLGASMTQPMLTAQM